VPFGFAADAMPSPTTFVPEQRKRLESLVTKALATDAPPVTYRVDVGDASQCILDAARRADSIVMSTSGRSGLSHLLIGSVAEKVVRHATVPVLTIRVPEKTGARSGAKS
jgi:universal stress protein A